jgi:hypothetical protein
MTRPERPEAGSDGRASLEEVVRSGRDAFASVFGREPESVSEVERVDEGWRLVLEVTELERIPQSTNVMASYEIRLDDQGGLEGYRRTKRYYRNQAGEG